MHKIVIEMANGIQIEGEYITYEKSAFGKIIRAEVLFQTAGGQRYMHWNMSRHGGTATIVS